MNEYFHLASVKLEAGSIIVPGNWGRMLRRYQRLAANGGTVGDGWLLARETIFEKVRLAAFVDKPSRLESAFCCLSLEDAIEYQARNDLARFNLIYRVRLADEQAVTHQGPLAALDALPPGAVFLESTENLAAMYWAGNPEGMQELVTASRLEVIGVCG